VSDITSNIKNKNIKWVHLWFTDLLGGLRQVTVSSKLIDPSVFDRGLNKLDGSSVKGFSTIEDSDLMLKPVAETFAVIPWEPGVARFISRIYKNSSRYSKDPRYVAEKLDQKLGENNLKLFSAAELEFFVFDKVSVALNGWNQHLEILSSEGFWSAQAPFNRAKDGYYTPFPKDRFEYFKREVAEVLENYFNIEVEAFHHEAAGVSQHELNFRGGTAVYVGDAVQTIKYVVKALAYQRGCIATFMPKPIYGDNGSGMHIHVSIWKDRTNLFYDPSDEYAGLSQFARYFIGGLIEHGRALSAIVSPTVNSYKRLVPGYEAPVYLVWSKANRSAAIRIPSQFRNGDSVRVEYRPPDPSANPYLAVAAIVMAGLDGVNKKIDPGDPVDENVYKMTPSRRRALGITELPRSLEEALDELESDNEWLKPVFDDDLIKTYIEVKRNECRKISSYPTPAEVYYYIDV